jgi:hypothetical protein
MDIIVKSLWYGPGVDQASNAGGLVPPASPIDSIGYHGNPDFLAAITSAPAAAAPVMRTLIPTDLLSR